ncbi:Uncharacterised protein [BD1-7 clade bacterium]|uniref:DUF1315 domain-containing protein n=1 Tax=BD1-7 clade bacterium TaxID=2029982 RepID=A0A5S9PVF8_9GAMM|nr:Uncharacterised protein [BD1-7 clade bacterium]CAA0108967.1 Uncharacterised protein [BD1-7 clade bacterium]
MDFEQMIAQLDDAAYQRLKRAVEIGKWPDGRVLSNDQREASLQAVIAYEMKSEVATNERTGFVDMAGSSCHSDAEHGEEPTILKWKNG